MVQNKSKMLLVAGLAAFAYYKYNSMSPEAKKKLTDTIKEKAKGLFEQYVPAQARDMFKSPESAGSAGNTADTAYGRTI